MTITGFVSLVGAGPGVKDHLTYRAMNRLQRADLILYDALIDPSILELAGHAQRFYVGKRSGRHSMSQTTIEALMIRHARDGKRVVRLKAGDPFVFGRGGEEALALSHANVPYEVVPGLSSAIAAPAFGGIPVTHRTITSACTIVTGHAEATYGPVLDAIPPHLSTLVVLMGFENRAHIAARLLQAGWSPNTPCALVAGAGTAKQRDWRGPLTLLAETTTRRSSDAFDPEGAPVTLVIGDTVALSDVIRKPLPTEGIEDNNQPSTSPEVGRIQP